MKKVINHTGWLKSLLFIPILFISEIVSAFGLIFSGFEIPNPGAVSSISELVLGFQKFSALVISLILIALFMKFIDKQKFLEIGFQLNKRFKDIIFGIILGFVIYLLAFFILLIIGQINFIGYNFNINKILVSIFLFASVSIYEEVIFRGYMLKNLLESFNPYVALFISSIFFSLIHGANPNVTFLGLCNIFLAGFFLGVSYIFTKNLWFPIALHFSWNFFQTMFGFSVSGMDFYSIVQFEILENNYLNGGKFGFESSVLSLIIILISTILIWKYYRSNSKEFS